MSRKKPTTLHLNVREKIYNIPLHFIRVFFRGFTTFSHGGGKSFDAMEITVQNYKTWRQNVTRAQRVYFITNVNGSLVVVSTRSTVRDIASTQKIFISCAITHRENSLLKRLRNELPKYTLLNFIVAQLLAFNGEYFERKKQRIPSFL